MITFGTFQILPPSLVVSSSFLLSLPSALRSRQFEGLLYGRVTSEPGLGRVLAVMVSIFLLQYYRCQLSNHQISPTLVTLPIEIRSIVLNHLSSLSDLAALTRTCTAYRDVYAENPARYVSTVAIKNILDDGGNLRDPLAAIWSCSRLPGATEAQNYDGGYKSAAIAFLDRYRRAEETHYFDIREDELPISDALALVELQMTADCLTDDIVDWVSELQYLIKVFS